MTDRLNIAAYDRVFALDTQMVFEARPLEQLDWQSLSRGPILLLILPQVSSEVDVRKRDGRLGQRARALNRQLDPSIESGAPATIVERPVRVDLAYVAADQIDWSTLDDLERDNGDDRIVAQALHALIEDPARLELMSFDSRPRAAARRHGLRAVKPAETWLLDPEPSANERRVAELKKRVKLLQTTEPELRVSLRALDDAPLVRHVIELLPEDLVKRVSRAVVAKYPRQRTGGIYGLPSLNQNSHYDEDYNDWEKALRERDIPALSLGVARQFSAYMIAITLENAGALAAEHVTVELRSGNAVLHAQPFMVDLFGPPPPSTDSDLFHRFPSLVQQLARPDRTSFAVAESEAPGVQVEYRCEDFRHGRSQTLTAIIELTNRTGNAAHVEVRVTAGNMRGDVTARLVAAVIDQDTVLGDLIDLDTLGMRVAPPTRDLIITAMKEDDGGLTRYRNDGARRS